MSMHPTRNLFKEFPNPYFVETGTYNGDAIQLAIDAGFERIISMDVDPKSRAYCIKRFKLAEWDNKLPGLRVVTADSAIDLRALIKNCEQPITFWLDAHWLMWENTDPGPNPFPLIDELRQIMSHPIKTHTIIIDDMRLMQKDICGFDKEIILEWLKKININYKFTFFANPMINDILVAHI